MTAASSALDFYRQPGKMTDPGTCSALLQAIPPDSAAICRTLQGLLLHEHMTNSYGVTLSDERRQEVQTRRVEDLVRLMQSHDSRPLTEPRSLDDRVIGNCRDFTMVSVAILRQHGIAARARCGFGAYFVPNMFVDHWVAEYWNPAVERWIRFDAQIDAVQRGLFTIDFDLLDVPHDRFLIAADAWNRCRSGELDPAAFAMLDMSGLWFVAGNLVRDAAALNNMEMLPWDCWGAIPELNATLSEEQLAFFDHLAMLTHDPDSHFSELRALYESGDEIRVPGTVFNAVMQRIDEI